MQTTIHAVPDTVLERGLTSAQAAGFLRHYGFNDPAVPRGLSITAELLFIFVNPLVITLFAHVQIDRWIAGCAVLWNWGAKLQAIVQLDNQEIIGWRQLPAALE
jgi:hypothetical protein